MGEVTVSTADRRGPVEEWIETWRHRELMAHMLRRELRTQYNRSLLGWAWSLINPLTTLLIYSVVFGIILSGNDVVPRGAAGIQSFPLFLFSALVAWNVYSTVSTEVMQSFAGSLQLRNRIYFPAGCQVLVSAVSALIVLTVEVAVLAVAFLVATPVHFALLGLVPVVVLAALLGLGVGLMLSVPNVRYRDVGYLYGVFLRFFFFLTPIIYPMSILEGKEVAGLRLDAAIRLNPLTHYVDAIRRVTYVHEWPPAKLWAIMLTMSLAAVVVGWSAFTKYAPDAAEGR